MSSYYEAIPIYRSAMDTAVCMNKAEQRFSKAYHYTLRSKLRALSAELLLLVARSNTRAPNRHITYLYKPIAPELPHPLPDADASPLAHLTRSTSS